tara:strand:- start:17609 stop:18262 length:654 start_codon:yes stop_codon:yes gene_type:complete
MSLVKENNLSFSFNLKIDFDIDEFENQLRSYAWEKIKMINDELGCSDKETNIYYWETLGNKNAMFELMKFTPANKREIELYLIRNLVAVDNNNNAIEAVVGKEHDITETYRTDDIVDVVKLCSQYLKGFDYNGDWSRDDDLQYYIETWDFIQDKLDIADRYLERCDYWERECIEDYSIIETYGGRIRDYFLKNYWSPYTKMGKRRFNKSCDELGCYE